MASIASIASQARPTLIGGILLALAVAPWADHRPRLEGERVAKLVPSPAPEPFAGDPHIFLEPSGPPMFFKLPSVELPSASLIRPPCHDDAQDYPRGMVIRPPATNGGMIWWAESSLDTLLSVLIAPLLGLDPGPPTRLL